LCKKDKTMTEDNEDFLDEELLNSDSVDTIDIDEENKGLYSILISQLIKIRSRPGSISS
jgi:hypothetical protein